MVKASVNLVIISPVFLVEKNRIGSEYTWLKYPSIRGISIRCERYNIIQLLRNPITVWVNATTENIIKLESNTFFNPYGITSSIIILLNIANSIPRIVIISDASIAKANSFFEVIASLGTY